MVDLHNDHELAGALKALVRLIQAAVEGRKLKASEPFHAEILEHLAELQRTDPAVRAALSEVGGLEEILSIVEAGATIRAPTFDNQLVAVEVWMPPPRHLRHRSAVIVSLDCGYIGVRVKGLSGKVDL